MAEFKVIGGPRDGTTSLINVEANRFNIWVLLHPPMTMSSPNSAFPVPTLDRYIIDWKEKVLRYDPEKDQGA